MQGAACGRPLLRAWSCVRQRGEPREGAARADGCAAIELCVNRNNPSVHAYRHLGFNVAAEATTDISRGFIMDDYLMRKPLP